MDENVKNLQVLHWNCRSIRNKLLDLKITLYCMKPHVVALQETWLKNMKRSPRFISYNVHRLDRPNGKGGGLMFLVRKDLQYSIKTLQPFPQGNLEVQALSIKSGTQSIDIMNIYNPHQRDMSKRELLFYKSQLINNCFILGDLNAHHPQWEPSSNHLTNSSGNILFEIINDIRNNLSLATPPDLPTYTNPASGETSTIDLFLCPPSFLAKTNLLTVGDLGSDHTPVMATIQVTPDTQKFGKRPQWIFAEERWDNWVTDVERSIINPGSVSEEVRNFTKALIDAGETHFKKSKDHFTDKYNKYWWNKHTAKATFERRRAKKKMERLPILENVLSYRRLHAVAIRIHNLAKRMAWRDYISNITSKTSSYELWKIIKGFRGINSRIRSPLIKENNLVYDTQEKTDILAQQIQKEMSSDNVNYNINDIRVVDRMANNNDYEEYNDRFTLQELTDAIDCIHADKACGIDYVHNQFLKHIPENKLVVLLGIMNRIWRSGEFPEEWKLALIIPILKEDKDPKQPSSYRPISLLSCLSKVLERMVYTRLIFHIETNKILSNSQYGFRIRRNTIDPVIALEHQIRLSMRQKKVTLVVFFDLKSAFDKVNHYKLFKVLADIGIKGNMLSWLISFLSDRKIQVCLENFFSAIYSINQGVPQGSIISPLLFIILLCKLPNIVPVVSKEFADDLVFSVTADTLEDAELLMQDAIERLLQWCKDMELVLNPTKTKAMCFTSMRDNIPTLKLDGNDIEAVSSFKYLGMTLDAPFLTWNSHIVKLKKECIDRIKIMRALSGTTWGADRDSLRKVYDALIKSKLAYGCAAYITTSASRLKTLEVIQNTAMRIMTGAWYSSRIPTIQCEANIPPLDIYLKSLSVKMFYRISILEQDNPVHEAVILDDSLRDQTWTKFFKKPFTVLTKSIIHNWGLPATPDLKKLEYPVVPPWYDLVNFIHLELEEPVLKSMNFDYIKAVTLSTISNRYKDRGFLEAYTDGSKSMEHNTVGAGFCIPDFDLQCSWKLNDYSSIVAAELSAIHKCTIWLKDHLICNKVVIFSDSQTSLYLLLQKIPKTYVYSLNEIHKNLMYIKENGCEIHLQWIPGHTEIDGNNLADSLAKQGRNDQVIDYHVDIKDIYTLVKRKSTENFQMYWDVEKQNTSLGLIKPQIGDWLWCRHPNRVLDVLITRLRLGKISLNKYLKKIGACETDLCTLCPSGNIEDVDHFLLYCSHFDMQRNVLVVNLRNIGIGVNNITVPVLLGAGDYSLQVKKLITAELGNYIVSTQRFKQG